MPVDINGQEYLMTQARGTNFDSGIGSVPSEAILMDCIGLFPSRWELLADGGPFEVLRGPPVNKWRLLRRKLCIQHSAWFGDPLESLLEADEQMPQNGQTSVMEPTNASSSSEGEGPLRACWTGPSRDHKLRSQYEDIPLPAST